MPQILPFKPNIPFYRFTTTLDGIQFIFDVHWNGREEAWYFDIIDDEGEVIRAGNKIALGSFPTIKSQDARKPPGLFFPVDTTGDYIEATYQDIGVRVQVYYYTAQELVDLGAGL